MTCVTVSYIFLAPEGFSLSPVIAYSVGIGTTLGAIILFYVRNPKLKTE